MIAISIWGRPSAFLLLSSCFLTVYAMYTQDDVLNARRTLVLEVADFDPCSKGAMWMSMSSEERSRAMLKCRQAHEAFTGLTHDEQKLCSNASAPACRAKDGCNSLQFTCTFMCDVIVPWRRDDKKRMERVNEVQSQAKNLKAITKGAIIDPPDIPLKVPSRNKQQHRSKSLHPWQAAYLESLQ